MQAFSAWTPPIGTLGRIVAEARQRADALRPHKSELSARAAEACPAAPFGRGLCGSSVGVIAEVKRRSPSRGWINPGMSAADQASAYGEGGAAAISVLTEPVHFGGSLGDLQQVRAAVGDEGRGLAVLRKDFHVDPVQLVEAKGAGASAALLIVRALGPDALPRMMDSARSIGLEVLVEVRDEEELRWALDAGAAIVGINNRNLETLIIDPETSARLLALVPAAVIAVAESGVGGRADVVRVAKAGADAVLVGSTLSAADDPTAAVRQLVGVPRTRTPNRAGPA